MTRSIYLTVIAIQVATIIYGQCIRLDGVIYDGHSRETLPGAHITSSNNPALGASSNDKGNFSITLTPSDSVLQVSFIGYQTLLIRVSAASNCFASIDLMPRVTQMQELTVKAGRLIAEEFAQKKIKKLGIYTNPSAKADPILAVGSSSSSTTLDESANISLRGGSPDETGIFLNDVPINDAVRYSQLNGIGTFSIFNTSLIDHVKVFPGNPPLEYGNSTSGVIALYSDEVIPSRRVMTASLTMANVGFYASTKLNEKSSLTGFTNYQPAAVIRALNPDAMESIKGFTSNDVGLYYYMKGSSGITVKLFNYSLIESYRFHYKHPSYSGIFRQNKKRNFSVANVRKKIGTIEMSYNQGLSFSSGDYQFGILDMQIDQRDVFSSLNMQHTGKTLAWKTGLSVDHKSAITKGEYPTYDYAMRPTHPGSNALSTDRLTNPEGYGYVKRYLGDRWIVGAGIRKNFPVDDLPSYLSTQGNVLFKANENWTINTSAGRYNKFYINQEGSGIALIASRQVSVDTRYEKGNDEFAISLFARKSTSENIHTTVKGIELFATHRISPSLRFQLSLTSLDASRQLHEIVKPAPYNIRYFLRGNIEYKFRGTWTLTFVFLLRQGSYYYPIMDASFNNDLMAYEPNYSENMRRLPSYNTFDMSLNKIFLLTEKATAIAFCSVGNAANFENVREYNYNHDYTTKEPFLFSKRLVYFGLVVNF